AHVGDSRAYLLNSRGVTLLSEDHSLPAQLLREGSISPQAAKTHPQKNVLTRSLGQNPRIEVYENQTVFESGDHLLLCSDGLYNMVEEDELFAITLTSANPESALRTMLEKSLQRGGFDNISAVLLYHD
ncbi:MAG: serine/threonine-protein phosphatase, partial [Clostridiales bacterium]|nr:serine/threonine-protein phosphatase [Clostridiales bacterium]